MERTIRTEIPKALVLMAVPTTDGFETARRRNLGFLGTVIDDRLRLDVRERLGAAYAPAASAQASRVYPGVGLVTIQAMSDPDKVERLVEACKDVLRDLAQNGVTEGEVRRLAEPVLARLRDARRQNGFWLGALAQAQTAPEDLEEIRTAIDFYRNLSAEELSKLAAQYLPPERASILVVAPERAAEEPANGALEAGAPKDE
jgi:zinc protease